MLNTIKKRKTAYLDHVLRGERYQFLQLIIEGKIEDRRDMGRKKMSWLRNIRQWTGLCDMRSLVNTARDRENVIVIHPLVDIHHKKKIYTDPSIMRRILQKS